MTEHEDQTAEEVQEEEPVEGTKYDGGPIPQAESTSEED
jgi:hypothetical protein